MRVFPIVRPLLLLPVFLLALWVCGSQKAHAQGDSLDMLLTNVQVKLDVAQAINDLYNFKFDRAEQQFRWLKQYHPQHPLPYFLMGLSTWWKIMPAPEVEKYDDELLAFMDTAIVKAKKMYERNPQNPEASFFLAAAYSFKGRIHSDRHNWSKATYNGKQAFKYLRINQGDEEYSVEFLFGEALFNYYAEWIKENYFLLRPVMAFFPKGNKKQGIEQLKQVSQNAFYTRTEAQTYLMRIYALEEDSTNKAYFLADYLSATYPDNAYFERWHARLSYMKGNWKESEKVSRSILNKIEAGMPGYEGHSGRYATFFLGNFQYMKYKQPDSAERYFKRCIRISKEIGATDKGYYFYSKLYLGDIAKDRGNKEKAEDLYKWVKRKAKRDQSAKDAAKERLNKLRYGKENPSLFERLFGG